MTIEEIAAAVSRAAGTLFEQFRYSNGFTSVGDSELAEAALVIHVAAEFIREGHAVWPESPFRTTEKGGVKHLDLLIQPKNLDSVEVLAFEAKAVSKGYESKKVSEIIQDHARICDWQKLDPKGRPIFFSVDPPESVTGVLGGAADGGHRGW